MLKLVKKIAKVVLSISERRQGALHGKQIAILFTYPPGINGSENDRQGIYTLPALVEEKLLFKGAQAFRPEGDVVVASAINGEVEVHCDYVLSCSLAISFGKRPPGAGQSFSNEFRLKCSLWNKDGSSVCEQTHLAYGKLCEPGYGEPFHDLAENAAKFVENAILPPEATAA